MSKLLQEALAKASLDPRFDDRAGVTSEDSDQETPLHSRPPSRLGARSSKSASAAGAKSENPIDPLQRLPKDLACRIFVRLDEADLKTLRRVCKRYNKSQTLNFVWFCKFNARSFDGEPLPLDDTWKPTWTRRESRQQWFQRYKQTFRRDDLEYRTVDEFDRDRAHSSGYLTPREEKEARWAAEDAAAQSDTMDKSEARAYYKGLKNSKAKGKGKFAGASSRDKSGALDQPFD